MHPEVTSPLHRELITDRSTVEHDVKAPQHQNKGSNGTTERSTKVSFNKGVRVYHHIHLNDFSDDEVTETWYNDEEIAEIKAECSLTINLLFGAASASSRSQAESLDTWSSLCFRGLEYRTLDGARNRRENKYLGWDKVLDEQESQNVIGEYDEEAIARAYREATRHCVLAASLIGLADAQAVRQQEAEQNIEMCVPFKENCHPMDMEFSSHSTKSQASLRAPKRRNVFNVVFVGQRPSAAGKQHSAAA